ncbi:hypothetical protein F4804DRAFT_328470, partial [Jackrogersella minutella]
FRQHYRAHWSLASLLLHPSIPTQPVKPRLSTLPSSSTVVHCNPWSTNHRHRTAHPATPGTTTNFKSHPSLYTTDYHRRI